MSWLPGLPWLWGGLAWLRRLRGVRRLLRTLGTLPHLLGSTTWRMNDKT